MYIIFALAIIMFGMSQSALAFTVTAEYVEPGQNADGTPLTDLKEVQLKWKQDSGAEQTIIVPSLPAGGKAVTKTFTAADPPACGKTTVFLTAEAVDLSGNHSPKAGPVTAVRDASNTVACQTPKAPTNLRVTIVP